MNSCHLSNKLEKFLDEALSDAEMLELDRHIECCPACTAELEQLRRIDALYKGNIFSRPPEAYWENTPARIIRQIHIRPAPAPAAQFLRNVMTSFRVPRFGIAVAGAFAALVLMFLLKGQIGMQETHLSPIADKRLPAPEIAPAAPALQEESDPAVVMQVGDHAEVKKSAIPQETPAAHDLAASRPRVSTAGAPEAVEPKDLLAPNPAIPEFEEFLAPLPSTTFIIAQTDGEDDSEDGPGVLILSKDIDGSALQSVDSPGDDVPDYGSDFAETLWIVQQSQSLEEKRNIWLSFVSREKDPTHQAMGFYNLALVMVRIAENSRDLDDAKDALKLFEEHEAVLRAQMKDNRYQQKVAILQGILQNK